MTISHFTVLVIGDDVDEQLAPYDENIEVEPYQKDMEVPFYARMADVPEDSTPEAIAEAYNAKYEIDPKDPDDRYEAIFVEDGRLFQWSTYNPRSKWDWYVVGGRWRGYFKLKENAAAPEDAFVGVPGTFGNPPQRADSADVLRKVDVDVEGMRAEKGAAAADYYDRFMAVVGDLPCPESWDSVRERNEGQIEKARKEYAAQPAVAAIKEHDDQEKEWEKKLLDPFSGEVEDVMRYTREEYIQRARDGAISPYAFVMDGEWHGRGDMGWWGISTNETDQGEWDRKFNELFDSLPDDTLLTLVDAHI